MSEVNGVKNRGENLELLFKIEDCYTNWCDLKSSFDLPLLGYKGDVPTLTSYNGNFNLKLTAKEGIVKSNMETNKVVIANQNDDKKVKVQSPHGTIGKKLVVVNPNNGKKVRVRNGSIIKYKCKPPSSSTLQDLLAPAKQQAAVKPRGLNIAIISKALPENYRKVNLLKPTKPTKPRTYINKVKQMTVNSEHNYFCQAQTNIAQAKDAYDSRVEEVAILPQPVQSQDVLLPAPAQVANLVVYESDIKPNLLIEKMFVDRSCQTDDKVLVDFETQTEQMINPEVIFSGNTREKPNEFLNDLPDCDLSNFADIFQLLNSDSNVTSVQTNDTFLGSNSFVQRSQSTQPWKVRLFLDLKNCNKWDLNGNLPLHNAVIQNNLKYVKRQCVALHVHKISINVLNGDSLTALQLAILHNSSLEIVETLLFKGADTDILDSSGSNILHNSVLSSNFAITKLLVSQMDKEIDVFNFDGYTPLMLATIYKMHGTAEVLLRAGSNPNLGDKKSGRTALFHAVENNDFDMVKLLLSYKAETKVKNFFGTSPHDAIYELDLDPRIKQFILNKYDLSKKVNKTYSKGKRKQTDESGKSAKIAKGLRSVKIDHEAY